MPTNVSFVQMIVRSDPYAKWARRYPIDAEKIARRLKGERTPEPGSLHGAGIARAIVAPSYTPDTIAHVRTVMRSQPYAEWAAVPSHGTDHRKLLRRVAGERTTSPSSLYAIGLGGLLYQPVRPDDPPDPIPPPPYVPAWAPDRGSLASVWRRDLVFTRSLSSFSGAKRDAARETGWSALAVQIDNVFYAEANRQELNLIRNELNASGWHVVGWATAGQGADSPYDEGIRHARIARENSLVGWVANMETWAESNDAWKCEAWINGWFAGGGDVPVAVSCMSSTTSDWAREFNYAVWINRFTDSGIFPQVYGATIPSYTVHNGILTLQRSKQVPRNRVGLTFDVIAGAGPFADYLTWDGPRQLWTGDDSTVLTFGRLARP